MSYRYTVGEASRYLNMDPKTLHRWCRQIGIIPGSSANGRVKLYSQGQLDRIALHLNITPYVSQHSTRLGGKQKHLPITQLQMVDVHLETLANAIQSTREYIAELLAKERA